MKYVADDWGLSREINDAILQLISVGLIQRVSVFAAARYTDYRIEELKSSTAEFSLHLDLTNNEVSPSLLALALRPPSDLVLSKAIEKQIDAFQRLGFHFQYLEAHEYAHCIPRVARCIGHMKLDSLAGVRKMVDWRHPLAAFSSAICFRDYYKSFRPLRVVQFFPGKTASLPMVIHPATSDSLDTRDPWRAKRVREFHQVMKLAAL